MSGGSGGLDQSSACERARSRHWMIRDHSKANLKAGNFSTYPPRLATINRRPKSCDDGFKNIVGRRLSRTYLGDQHRGMRNLQVDTRDIGGMIEIRDSTREAEIPMRGIVDPRISTWLIE